MTDSALANALSRLHATLIRKRAQAFAGARLPYANDAEPTPDAQNGIETSMAGRKKKPKPVSLAGPTPERLTHSAERPIIVTVEGAKRYVFCDGVVARLCARNALDRDDKARNDRLFLAASKWEESFRLSGLDPLTSRDLTVEVRNAHGPKTLFTSEKQVWALQDYRWGLAAIPEDFRELARQVILQDVDLTTAGRAIGNAQDAKCAQAVALFVLRRALVALARHYGLGAL